MEKIINHNYNGLELISIASVGSDFDTDELRKSLAEKIGEKSFVVLYLDYKVLIGTYENGDFLFYENEKFEDKFVQRIRVFNEKDEFLAWRTSNGFRVRFRQDYQGEKKEEVVEAYQALFGTESKDLNGYTKIEEKRGTKLILPLINLEIDDNKNRLFIKTHNYIDYNKLHQATYFDCRFVTFVNENF